MPKLIEIIDSLNNENAEEIKETLKAEASALAKINSQFYARAKKAEGFEWNKETKQWQKKVEKKPEAKKEAEQSNEPDYAKIAYLNSLQINHPDDQKWLMDEANRLKLPLTDVKEMEYAKSRLKTAKEQREAEAGMPQGRGSSSGKTKQGVDYWLDKKNPDGTYATPDNLDEAEKVIDARLQRDKKANMFSDRLYT